MVIFNHKLNVDSDMYIRERMIHCAVIKKPTTMKVVQVDLCLLTLLFSCLCCVSQDAPKALVISFDGFRYNYTNIGITPTLDKIGLNGTRAEYMVNVFETKTFPNHHSIATGLFPEYHGVIANSFYDPQYKKILGYSEKMWNYSNEILPIWIHNEEGGTGRYSGVYMWPGSNFKYNNKLPTFVQEYNFSVPWTDRVDSVINWFLDPKTPANLVMLYFEEPDFHSHKFGPDSQEVKEQIKKIDSVVNYLYDALTQKNLINVINIFFLSDHGMAPVPPEHLINVTHILKAHGDACLHAGSSPILHVIPNTTIEEEVYNALKNLSEFNKFQVFRKNDLPDQWLYKNNRRIPPIMLVADEGYAFDDIKKNGTTMYGVHGYDNNLKSMHPFFMAHGPRIKKNFTIAPFNSVDLFSLFCNVLDLNMTNTNGSFNDVKDMLLPIQDNSLFVLPVSNAVIAIASLFVLLMGCLVAVLIKNVYMQFNFRSYDANSGFNVSKEFENIHLLDSDDME